MTFCWHVGPEDGAKSVGLVLGNVELILNVD